MPLPEPGIRALFCDIGGVLLTNGWDRHARQRAAERFGLDAAELSERHGLLFGGYEEGRLTLDEYLEHAVFYEPRPFTRDEFVAFMFEQSRPLPEMLDLLGQIKKLNGIATGTICNEGRELAAYRYRTYGLGSVLDLYLCSCFVGVRKPSPEIYRMALDLTGLAAEQTVYVDDRPLLVEVAVEVGMHGIHHTSFETTRKALADLGLSGGNTQSDGDA